MCNVIYIMDKSSSSEPEVIEIEDGQCDEIQISSLNNSLVIEENKDSILTSGNKGATSLKRGFSIDLKDKSFKSRRLQRKYRRRNMDASSEDEAEASCSNTMNNIKNPHFMSNSASNVVENDRVIDLTDNTQNSSQNYLKDVSFRSRRLQRKYRLRNMDSSSEDEAEVRTSSSNAMNNKKNPDSVMSNSASNVVENDKVIDFTDDIMQNSLQNDFLNVSNDVTSSVQEDIVSESVNFSNNLSFENEFISARDVRTSSPVERTSNTRTRRRSLSSSTLDSDHANEPVSADEENNDRDGANEPVSAVEDNNDGDANRTTDNRSTYERMDERIRTREGIDKSVDSEVENIMNMRIDYQHVWNPFNALRNRELGMSGRRELGRLFSLHCYDSLYIVQRLEMAGELEFHKGCTNALNFSDDGKLLASSSDDLHVAVWDWANKKTVTTYDSGHRNNVLQCKFLSLPGNNHIVTCSRDGQVRLKELTPSGLRERPRRIARHTRSAHKVATRQSAPYCLMSAGEDALVFHIDIRSNRPDKIVEVTNGTGALVPLYSIDQNPANDNQFCVTGQDEYVRVFDRRVVSPFGPSMLKYCPDHIIGRKRLRSITCGVYSQNGQEILASYGEEDIYLFDTKDPDGSEHFRQYSGHCNISTVKGVSFFGPSGRFIVSGSDCGNIFFWDRESEAIVNFMHGDNKGVVNVLEPHPHVPVMATSGLDNSIKLWMPNFKKEPQMEGLRNIVRSNVRKREDPFHDDDEDEADTDDPQMVMMLFQQLRNRAASGDLTDYLFDLDADNDNVDDDDQNYASLRSTSEDSSSSSSENSFAAAMQPDYEEDNSDTNSDREEGPQCNTQ